MRQPSAQSDIDHRLVKPKHPCTMASRKHEPNAIKRNHQTVSLPDLQPATTTPRQIDKFLATYNFVPRLKIFEDFTLCEFICKTWITAPSGSA